MNAILQTVREFDLAADSWGGCMAAWFDIAAELWWRGEVPERWQYRPGAAADPRELESPVAALAAESSTDELLTAGKALELYSRLLRRAECDY